MHVPCKRGYRGICPNPCDGGRSAVPRSAYAGRTTQEYDSPDKWSAFYAEEALQKYDGGSFRKFGDRDYASWFAPHFETSLGTLPDVPTGMAVTWLKGIRWQA